jgi:hypothetical protein
LKYNTELGLTTGDSGFGRPTANTDWVRTGFAAVPAPDPGLGNCNAWTSASANDFGTNVFLVAQS